MKRIIMILCSMLLLISCGQEKNTLSIQEQSDLLAQDATAIKYFSTLNAAIKMMTESDVTSKEYFSILKQHNTGTCEAKKKLFNGNKNLETYADLMCQSKILRKKFYDRYPNIAKMKDEDRNELFLAIREMTKPNYDIEQIKKKAINSFNTLNQEEQTKLLKEAEVVKI